MTTQPTRRGREVIAPQSLRPSPVFPRPPIPGQVSPQYVENPVSAPESDDPPGILNAELDAADAGLE